MPTPNDLNEKNEQTPKTADSKIGILPYICCIAILGLIACLYPLFTSQKDIRSANQELLLKDAKIMELTKELTESKQELADCSTRLEKQDPHKSIVDFIKRKQPKLDPKLRDMYADIIAKYSKKFGFPPELIASVAFRESAFHEGARSSVKCFGLMQINPIHTDKFKQLGISLDEAHHIDNNIHLGCIILRDYYNQTKDIRKALLKYVGGNLPSYVNDILGYTVDALIIDNIDASKIEKGESWKTTKPITPKPTKKKNS